jgi:hypothetical protein
MKTLTMTMIAIAGLTAAAGADTKAPDAKKAPEAAMPMPKAPAEVSDMLKSMSGTWKCTGKAFMPDGTSVDMTGTMKSKSDLDAFWIHDSMDGKIGKMPFKFEAFSTYDAATKKWRRVGVDNMGGQRVGTSDGIKDGKQDYALDTVGAMGAMMVKEHMDASDAKNGVKVSGEMSMDKGKTWVKEFEATCKK